MNGMKPRTWKTGKNMGFRFMKLSMLFLIKLVLLQKIWLIAGMKSATIVLVSTSRKQALLQSASHTEMVVFG